MVYWIKGEMFMSNYGAGMFIWLFLLPVVVLICVILLIYNWYKK